MNTAQNHDYGQWVAQYRATWLDDEFEVPQPAPELTNRQLITYALEAVGAIWRITPLELRARTRKGEIPEIRYAAMRLIRNVRKVPYKDIAHGMGLKHHATVIHGLKMAELWAQLYPAYASKTKAAGDLLDRKIRGLR